MDKKKFLKNKWTMYNRTLFKPNKPEPTFHTILKNELWKMYKIWDIQKENNTDFGTTSPQKLANEVREPKVYLLV